MFSESLASLFKIKFTYVFTPMNTCFCIVLGSPLAVEKVASTLPGINKKHDIVLNINRQEQLKDRKASI
jgi:glycine cleavage system regulatory protein